MSKGDYAVQAGKAGLLEKLDFSVIDKSKLDPRFVTDYSVGSFYYSLLDRLQQGRCLGLPEKLGRCVRHRKIPR